MQHGVEILDQPLTSVSLLFRLQSTHYDDEAWSDFVHRYGGHIYAWCRNRRLSEVDAEDVTQDVLLRLARHMATFRYDPQQSFRGWLRRVTENAICDFASPCDQPQEANGSKVLPLLAQEPAREQLISKLEDVFDLEVFEEAKRRVQARVTATRWQSWQQTTELAVEAREIAAQLGISMGTLYANKNQIQKLIQQEVALLNDCSETSPENR